MAFQINEYLRQQSIRLQREDWKQNAQLLGDELYTIMRNIQLLPEDPTSTDENGNPINIPDITPLPPITTGPGGDDPDFGANPEEPQFSTPVVDPDPDDPTGAGNSVRNFYQRFAQPGKITSEGSGGLFSCDLYYNGLEEPPRQVTVKLTDSDLADDVSTNDWVTVFVIAKYEGRTSTTDGQTTPETITATRVEYLFNAPGGGGGKIGVVTTEISGGSADEPGEGTVVVRDLVDGNWVTGGTETVYSTVTGKVKAGKDVQMKRVSGRLFVDVEDCGGQDDDPTQGGG